MAIPVLIKHGEHFLEVVLGRYHLITQCACNELSIVDLAILVRINEIYEIF